MFRFTEENIRKTLELNEGYTDSTYYSSRNLTEQNSYEIKDGSLIKRSQGKTSWADSRYDETTVCDIDQTRRFLRERKDSLILPD